MVCPDPTTFSGPVGDRLTIPTHDGSGQATHPSVLHFPAGFGGFAYWMAHTPLPGNDDSHEDPNIVASNDGINWVVPDGLSNPIDDQPGSPGAFNSDVDLKLGPDNTLYLFWRTYDQNATGAEEKLYYSTSGNGVDWSPKILFLTNDHTVRRLLSPTLLFEGGTWTMWAVDIIPSPNTVVRLAGGAFPEDAWSSPQIIDVGPMQGDKEPWHIYVMKDGDCYVGLLADATLDTTATEVDLLLLTSLDGLAFTNGGGPVIPRFQPDEHDWVYRAALIPEAGGYRIWYGARRNGPTTWHIYRTLIFEPTAPQALGLPDVGVAQIRTRMTWLGCDLVTGRRIAELHDITGQVSRLIGAYTSANLTVPIPLEITGRAPLQTVLQATDPARTMIVAVVNDLPLWAGIPLPRERGTEADMPLGCVTIEGYLDRRYVGDHDLVDVDEAVIAATLVGDANVEGIGIVVDAPPTGTLRERHYKDHDDVTVYQRLQELSQVQGGPEWTIDLDWADDTKRIVQKIFRLRKRLGTAADPPTAVFQTTSNSVFQSRGGSEARYRFTEDRTDGRYANHVVAVGSGEGEDRVQSAPARDTAALASGQPRWESRIRPSTSTTSVAVLDDHAAAELARRKDGANTWKITARWDAYPRYGVDWRLGDDIGWRLFGHGHPAGVAGQGRGIGFELDSQAGVLSPILLEPDGEVI